jgi:catechol 2,3-dioxygenase-like lactoylglutathione lyase family enzyme
MIRIPALTITVAALTAWLAVSVPAYAGAANEAGRVVGLAFAGRNVADLGRSVAFYEALGFERDPAAQSVWRHDEVVERIYGIEGAHGVTTRMAKMYVKEPTGGRFVHYLRELKGIHRRDLSRHTAWEPGASHFGLVVPDAQALWSHLQSSGLLHARSWGGRLIAPPGQTKGMIAYITDPDGLDIEIIDQRPAMPAAGGRTARPALLPGVNHVGLIVLDSDKARTFYGNLLGGRLASRESPWLKGDFYDAAVGGHGNILRFFNESFPAAFESLPGVTGARASAAPGTRINFELVEFQNRKKPVERRQITDIGVGYVGFEVDDLNAFLVRARAAGAILVSNGIATMRGGTHVAMLRDPDVGGFVEVYDHPKQ